MYVSLVLVILVPVGCLVFGAVLGASVRRGSEADAWNDGYEAGYEAGAEDQVELGMLAPPRFIGEE